MPLIPNQHKLISDSYLVFLFIFISNFIIIFDITILRQLFGFAFLAILPGLIILNILKINTICVWERFVIIWGISISFLMFIGLLIDAFADMIGYTTPLKFDFFLLLFDLIIILLAIIGFLVNKESVKSNTYSLLSLYEWLKNLYRSPYEKALIIIPILLPAISVFGMHIMNVYNLNIVLIIYYILIAIYISFACLFHRNNSNAIYPIIIYLISLSLVLVAALRSDYIIGYDAHDEFGYFLKTLSDSHWQVENKSLLDSCLVISILPTIYNIFLSLDKAYLFKILYPLLFSIIPLIIFIIANRYIGPLYAFLASFFYMSQRFFLYTTSYPRSNLAILFFSLAIMVLLNKEMDNKNRKLLFLLFLASCVVSHYSTTFIFFFLIVVYWLASKSLSKLLHNNYSLQDQMSLLTLILFFVIIFFWYSQITDIAFGEGLFFIKKTIISLGDIFIEESRSSKTEILLGEGIVERPTPYRIEFILTWLTFIFTGLGVISLASNCLRQTLTSLKTVSRELKFKLNYLLIALICSGLLVATLLIPYIARGYSIERQYLQAMVVLSACFVMGGIFVYNIFLRIINTLWINNNYFQSIHTEHIFVTLVILMILVPYFLCITGVMYVPFNVPREMTLNSEGYQYNSLFVHTQDISCGEWLNNYADPKGGGVYTDMYAWLKLRRFHNIRSTLNNSALISHKKLVGYIYLSYYNLLSKKLLATSMKAFNFTEYAEISANRQVIYNNGGSEIWN